MTPREIQMNTDRIRDTLGRCLEFEQIRRSGHLSRFLTFVVEQRLAGAQSEISETAIAVQALERDDGFDPRLDPVVRVVAGRLRRALEMYALTDGVGDAVRIVLPKGSYVPWFEVDEGRAGEADGPAPGDEARLAREISVLLVDDHVMLRRGLRALLDSESDLSVVGEAGDGAEALELARSLTPRVVVMDVTMPGTDGIEATKRLCAERRETGVVALSVHAGQRFVGDMLRAGARGYVLKESAPEELVLAIRAVARGETYLSPGVAGGVVSRFIEASPPTDESPLSEAHRRLLELLAEGYSMEDLADELGTTRPAVEATIGDLIERLDMGSVAELTTYAEGVLGPR